MISVLTKIVAAVAGLAILLTAYFGGWGRALKGFGISIAIVIAVAIAIAALRRFRN